MDQEPESSQPSPNGSPAPKVPLRGLFFWVLLGALFLSLMQLFTQGKDRLQRIPFSPDFIRKVDENKIRKCEIVLEVSGFQFIRGDLTDLDERTGKPARFRTEVVVTDDLIQWLKEKKVGFEFKPQSPMIWQMLTSALPFLLILGLLYFLFARQIKMAGRGAMSFGKSRARLLAKTKNITTFEHVAGIDEAREEVQEIIDFLKDPKRFQKLGGRIPKGVLLVGPPGTGKTLLARAIAGEAHVPFFNISGSDFVEMFVGVGASRVRDMFEQGKKNAPCIIFIDEIDAVGRSRFSGIGGGHDEREQTLNALLVEMDGFDTQEGVIIIAATNRPDVLDNALLRPGRFDRQIMLDLPTLDGREKILQIHSKTVRLGRSVDLRRTARGTPGFSGADLANLINESALLAARRGAEAIEMPDLEEARDKVRWGRERRSRHMDDTERRLTATHEAGHAVVLHLIGQDPVHKVTIIPRGQAMGATMQLPEKDRYSESRTKLLNLITGLMGGRAAEELVFKEVTTGAQMDFRQATHVARMMVCEWGMSEILGPQSFTDSQELLFMGREVQRTQSHSEETSRKIDSEISRILQECHDHAVDLLKTHWDPLNKIANLLLERETLDGVQVAQVVEHGDLLPEAGPERPEPVTGEDSAAGGVALPPTDSARSAAAPEAKTLDPAS